LFVSISLFFRFNLFIGLRLGGVISWSWLWVVAPLWIPLLLGLVVIALLFVGYFVHAALTTPKRKP